MQKRLNNIISWLGNHLALLVLIGVAALCAAFMIAGTTAENGSITLDGQNAKIDEATEQFIEDAQATLARIMNVDAPTDQATVEANDEATGQGFYTTLTDILSRRRANGDNDADRGWQCSKYTAYLATGKKDYSSSHTDYGPVNGNQVVDWLVRNYGFKYIDTPVAGAIGSGGFNTTYGHTVMYLYGNTVNDANWSPLSVSTHTMDLAGYRWVVPADYEPTSTVPQEPAGKPEVPSTTSSSYRVQKGDTLGGISLNMGWWPSTVGLYGDTGYAQRLANFNNIPNRGLIYPTQVIRKAD